jgi:hypothetical protein
MKPDLSQGEQTMAIKKNRIQVEKPEAKPKKAEAAKPAGTADAGKPQAQEPSAEQPGAGEATQKAAQSGEAQAKATAQPKQSTHAGGGDLSKERVSGKARADVPQPQTPGGEQVAAQGSQDSSAAYAQDNANGIFPTIEQEANINAVPVGSTFLAAFVHNPHKDGNVTDQMRHVQRILPDLISGKVKRLGLSAGYWASFAHLRPPRAERTQTGFRLLD